MGTCYSHLSPDERIRIERLHCEQGLSIRRTAELVGRDKATVSRELKRGLRFASNENESYRPYRPKRLKTGPWTSMPFCSALAAQEAPRQTEGTQGQGAAHPHARAHLAAAEDGGLARAVRPPGVRHRDRRGPLCFCSIVC